MIARKRMAVEVPTEARKDLEELDPAARDAAVDALSDLAAHPRAGEPKTGRLKGARSWDFEGPAGSKGRIVYRIKGSTVIAFAIHDDHDEAYRRARERVPRFL